MKTIDIKELENIKEKLDVLKDDVIYVQDGDENKYVIMPYELYKDVDDVVEALNDRHLQAKVEVIPCDDIPSLTYEEYENVKKQIIKAFDDNFKPNPEKLN